MNMICERCGGPIARQTGPGGRRRYCEACSPRRDRPDRPRKNQRPTTEPRYLAAGQITSEATSVYSATVAELDAMGMPEDHWLRVLALNVAWHIDHNDGSASGLVALVKEHRAVLAACAAAAPKPEDALTRLRRERLGR